MAGALQAMPPAQAGLLAAEPVKNGRALLRNSLPISNKTIREIQVGPCGTRPRRPPPGGRPTPAATRRHQFCARRARSAALRPKRLSGSF